MTLGVVAPLALRLGWLAPGDVRVLFRCGTLARLVPLALGLRGWVV
ncbi:hypothetical protein [Streptomyces hygroscopicus]|nr:hypothetical protein [Streptomyces hygroscopicus]